MNKEDSHLLTKSNDLTNCKSDETIYVPKIDQTPKNPTMNLTDALEDKNVNILGLNWNVESDKFHFDLTKLMEYAASLPPTKRSVLKVSAKIFDPIGILTPLTIDLKCLFQTLCTDCVDWDTELDGRSLTIWNLQLNDLSVIKSIYVPRCYFNHSNMIANHQIHGFSVASKRAFAGVVYL